MYRRKRFSTTLLYASGRPIGSDSRSRRIRRVVFRFVSSCPPIWWMISWLNGHRSKRALAARAFCVPFDDVLDPTSSHQVVGIGGSVYKERPVDIASLGELAPGEGTEHNNARVCGIEFGQLGLQRGFLGPGAFPSRLDMRPVSTEPGGQNVQQGLRHLHLRLYHRAGS
jgi:hypothetical protein